MNTASTAPKQLSRNQAIGLIVIAAALWSTSGLFIKLIDWHPLAIAGARSAIAAIVMLAVTGRRLRFTFSPLQLGGAVAYAATVITFVMATKMTTAANAILLQYTAPIYTAILAGVILKEKVSKVDWGVIALVVGGMSLFFLDKLSFSGLWGNVAAMVSGLSLACFVLCMRAQKDGSPAETVIIGNLLTALVGAPFILQSSPGTTGWAAIIFLGICQLGLPFLMYSAAIKHVNALEAVLLQVIEPLLNPIWVLLIVGEVPGTFAIIGGVVVFTAVTGRTLTANKKTKIQEQVEEENPQERGSIQEVAASIPEA